MDPCLSVINQESTAFTPSGCWIAALSAAWKVPGPCFGSLPEKDRLAGFPSPSHSGKGATTRGREAHL